MAVPPLQPPAPGPGVDWGNGYGDAYPWTGLAGLSQGFTQGLELGHKWNEQADALQMHKDQMADNAAWREETAKDRKDQNTILDKIRQQALDQNDPNRPPPGPPQLSTDGKFYWGGPKKQWVPVPTAKMDAKKEASLHMVASAYQALDKYQDLAKQALPYDSGFMGLGDTAMSIPEIVQSGIQHSPINNLKDKGRAAATNYAAAFNAAGSGTKMSEAEVLGHLGGMGGRGIGDNYTNMVSKIDPLRNELATRHGLNRQEVEEYARTHNVETPDILKNAIGGGGDGGPAPIRVTSQKQYEGLAKGTSYIDDDGNVAVKR